jgi:hypothetical protein
MSAFGYGSFFYVRLDANNFPTCLIGTTRRSAAQTHADSTPLSLTIRPKKKAMRSEDADLAHPSNDALWTCHAGRAHPTVPDDLPKKSAALTKADTPIRPYVSPLSARPKPTPRAYLRNR